MMSGSGKLVVIGASAGGVEALRTVVAGLPVDFAASVLIVLHLPPHGSSALADILGAAGRLPTAPATHGAITEPGHVYVAPPNHHLLVDETRMLLSDEPPESGHRPGVDALFRSAARARGSAVVGVVLSGALDDGTAGLVEIKAHGGLAIVQDPEEAGYRGMPDSALDNVRVDEVLPAAAIGERLARLLVETPGLPAAGKGKASRLSTSQQDQIRPGESGLPAGAPDDEIQGAVWTAVRTLEEKAHETATAAKVLRRWLTSASPRPPAQGEGDGREPG
jgi:two-component system chemotaxis response regulator CheB